VDKFKELEQAFKNAIEVAFATMEALIEEGEDPTDALEEFYGIIEDAILTYHRQAFLLGQEEQAPDPDALDPSAFDLNWPKGVAFQQERLRNFVNEMETEAENISDYAPRALFYAEAIWNPYLRGGLYYDPPDALYRWIGPGDERSCDPCKTQTMEGPRPLSQIPFLPGEAVCGNNCRCRLVRVK